MTNYRDISFLSSNGHTQVRLRCWIPDGPVQGTVQIAHGIAEHLGRYNDFCSFLAEHGFAVFINDHVGHGSSISSEDERGFFDAKNGWMVPVNDMHIINTKVCQIYPDVPHFLFGHSMGSFLARTYLFSFPENFNGVILCGTANMSKALLVFGVVLADLFALLLPKGHSKFLYQAAFGSYNNSFKPIRTDYDWLSRDTGVVDAYIADPDCGFICTNSLYADMMKGLLQIEKKENINKMEKNKPILFISGTMDPVGENTVGVKSAYKLFKSAGMKDVTLKFYDDCRHELLNELNKEEVFQDVLSWINKHICQEEEK